MENFESLSQQDIEGGAVRVRIVLLYEFYSIN